jgi:hypothetical protein
MDTQATTKELLDLERRYWRAIKDKDEATMRGLTDYPCIVTDAHGVGSLDEDTFAKMLNAQSWRLNDFALGDDVKVRMLSDDIAVIAYTVREEMTVEGEDVTLKAADASVWARRDGRWRCAVHTESVSGDPYGRDRRPAH